jgi:hypothetical protein
MRNRLLPYLMLLLSVIRVDGVTAQTGAQRQVFINRVRIPDASLAQLESAGAPRVPDGRYWYDRLSGAWGLEGGFTRGFIAPGIPLGGPLPADISGGGTGVFINGRELHPLDLAGLQQLTGPVAQGRYWLDAQGNAGYEGGPAIANLRALAASLYRQNGGVGENYGDGGGAYHNSRTGIGIITDGQGGAAVFNH